MSIGTLAWMAISASPSLASYLLYKVLNHGFNSFRKELFDLHSKVDLCEGETSFEESCSWVFNNLDLKTVSFLSEKIKCQKDQILGGKMFLYKDKNEGLCDFMTPGILVYRGAVVFLKSPPIGDENSLNEIHLSECSDPLNRIFKIKNFTYKIIKGDDNSSFCLVKSWKSKGVKPRIYRFKKCIEKRLSSFLKILEENREICVVQGGFKRSDKVLHSLSFEEIIGEIEGGNTPYLCIKEQGVLVAGNEIDNWAKLNHFMRMGPEMCYQMRRVLEFYDLKDDFFVKFSHFSFLNKSSRGMIAKETGLRNWKGKRFMTDVNCVCLFNGVPAYYPRSNLNPSMKILNVLKSFKKKEERKISVLDYDKVVEIIEDKEKRGFVTSGYDESTKIKTASVSKCFNKLMEKKMDIKTFSENAYMSKSAVSSQRSMKSKLINYEKIIVGALGDKVRVYKNAEDFNPNLAVRCTPGSYSDRVCKAALKEYYDLTGLGKESKGYKMIKDYLVKINSIYYESKELEIAESYIEIRLKESQSDLARMRKEASKRKKELRAEGNEELRREIEDGIYDKISETKKVKEISETIKSKRKVLYKNDYITSGFGDVFPYLSCAINFKEIKKREEMVNGLKKAEFKGCEIVEPHIVNSRVKKALNHCFKSKAVKKGRKKPKGKLPESLKALKTSMSKISKMENLKNWEINRRAPKLAFYGVNNFKKERNGTIVKLSRYVKENNGGNFKMMIESIQDREVFLPMNKEIVEMIDFEITHCIIDERRKKEEKRKENYVGQEME